MELKIIPSMSEKQVTKLSNAIARTLKIAGVKPGKDLDYLTRQMVSHCRISFYDGMLAYMRDEQKRKSGKS